MNSKLERVSDPPKTKHDETANRNPPGRIGGRCGSLEGPGASEDVREQRAKIRDVRQKPRGASEEAELRDAPTGAGGAGLSGRWSG